MKLPVLLSACIFVLSACQNVPAEPEPSYDNNIAKRLVKENYTAAETLVGKSIVEIQKNADTPLLVTTIVNQDGSKSKLGRTLSDQVQARLTQLGYAVVELRLRNADFISKLSGELLLSREVKEMAMTQKAYAVLIGTYSVANENVYVNLKLVNVNDVVISAYDYILPLNADIKALLDYKAAYKPVR